MRKKNTRVCIKRSSEKSDEEEKERKCRERLGGFLKALGYECSTDRDTLRAEAVRKLKEIADKKRNPQDSTSSHSDDSHVAGQRSISPDSVCEIKKTTRVPLPPNVKNYIKQINGSDEIVELVFEKTLTASDVNRSQGRLLMPLKQVQRQDILTQLEKRETVNLYLTSREERYGVRVTQWDMSGNRNYVLKSGWSKVVKENDYQLQKSTVVQLWSFQVGDATCLLLVPVDGGADGGDVNGNTADIGGGKGGMSYEDGESSKREGA